MTTATTNPLSGIDLKLIRLRAGVTAMEQAKAMGVTHPRINAIESAWRPTRAATQRYLGALESIVGPAPR